MGLNPSYWFEGASLVNDLGAFIINNGAVYRNWYVGIAADPEQRLFGDHGVNRTFGTWIYRPASSHEVARAAEQYFLSLGCAGGPGGGSFLTRFVYAYRML